MSDSSGVCDAPSSSGHDPRRVGHRSIARNTGHLISAQLVTRALRGVYMLVLARLLEPELFGLLSYAQFWQLLFIPFVFFGTGRVLSREIGRNPGQAAAVLANSLSLRILTGLAVATACAAAAWWLEPEPLERLLLVILSLTLLARGLANWSQEVFTAYEATHFTLRQEALWRSVEAVLGLTILALGAGLAGIALVHALSWSFQAGGGLWVVHRRLHPVVLGWEWRALTRLMRDGISGVLVIFSITVMLEGGLVTYRWLVPDALDLGQLAIVLQALAMLLMVPKVLAISALPVLSGFVAAGAGDERVSMAAMLRLALMGAAAVALIGLAAAVPLVALVLGPEYKQAGRWLGPALWLLLPFGVGQLLNQLLVARGDYWANARCAVTAALLTVLTLPPLIAVAGAGGVLVAAGLGLSVWALTLLRLVRHQDRLRLVPGLRRAVGTLAAAFLTWVILELAMWLGGSWPSGAALKALVPWLASVAALAVIALGIEPRERAFLIARLRRSWPTANPF